MISYFGQKHRNQFVSKAVFQKTCVKKTSLKKNTLTAKDPKQRGY